MANSKLKCTHCKKYELRDKGIKLPAGFFCSHSHAIAYARAKQDKAREKQKAKPGADKSRAAKADRAQHRKRKEALKTASDYIKEAQAAVNAYIRARDYGKPCISCDKTVLQVENEQKWKIGGSWDAGHFRSRGAAGHLRFNLWNIHKQCKPCNGGGGRFSHKAATVDQLYRENLITRIGVNRVEMLECDNKPRRFTIDYLKRMKKIFNRRTRMEKRRKGIE